MGVVKRGEIYWGNADPTVGGEIQKTRPILLDDYVRWTSKAGGKMEKSTMQLGIRCCYSQGCLFDQLYIAQKSSLTP